MLYNALFTEDLFNRIEFCARECAEPSDEPCELSDEMAVYDMLSAFKYAFDLDQLLVLRFCAEECERQSSGAMSVLSYVRAWNAAWSSLQDGVDLSVDLLMSLGDLIEPAKPLGYRLVTATACGGIVIGSDPEHIARDMDDFDAYLRAYQLGEREDHLGRPISAQSLYARFETVHPRFDGNGRLGKILYNWLEGTLDRPTLPALPEGFHKV